MNSRLSISAISAAATVSWHGQSPLEVHTPSKEMSRICSLWISRTTAPLESAREGLDGRSWVLSLLGNRFCNCLWTPRGASSRSCGQSPTTKSLGIFSCLYLSGVALESRSSCPLTGDATARNRSDGSVTTCPCTPMFVQMPSTLLPTSSIAITCSIGAFKIDGLLTAMLTIWKPSAWKKYFGGRLKHPVTMSKSTA
jgi:hypothetical protein